VTTQHRLRRLPFTDLRARAQGETGSKADHTDTGLGQPEG
jgi:hypothetical protein